MASQADAVDALTPAAMAGAGGGHASGSGNSSFGGPSAGAVEPKTAVDQLADSRDGMEELTVKSLVLGSFLSMLLAAANAYLGLKVGMTVSASIPASVISMAVLSLFKSHTVLENNQVQTCAASGPSITAGAIFTIPALLISGYWESFGYLPTLGIILTGGVLGIMFTIPLRRALIVGSDLQFPEGVATAAVLETGAREGGKAGDMWALGLSSLYGAVSKLCGQGLGLWAEDGCAWAWYTGKSVIWVGADLSVALVGVGYIVGLNVAFLCFAGGLVNWWIVIPTEVALHHDHYQADMATKLPWDFASHVWSTKTRYLGVGAMTTGGLWALVSLRRQLADAVRAAARGLRSRAAGGGGEAPRRAATDLPTRVLLPLLLAGCACFVAAAFLVTKWYAALVAGVVMLAASFVFAAVAAYMAGLVGSSNNPVSGVTISSILVCSLLLYALLGNGDAKQGAAAAIVIGSILCCSAAIGGDNMQDLKCGHLVGATPWKQQVSQLVGVLSGGAVIPLVLELLRTAYGFQGVPGQTKKNPLPAPQAALMQSVAEGVFSQSLPWEFIGAGAGMAVLCICIDEAMRALRCRWRCPVLAVAVGVYLPWSLTIPMMLGGLIAQFAPLLAPGEEAAHRGLLTASGLITGEAILGVLLAIPVASAGREDILYVLPGGRVGSPWAGFCVLIAAAAGLLAAIVHQHTRRPPATFTAVGADAETTALLVDGGGDGVWGRREGAASATTGGTPAATIDAMTSEGYSPVPSPVPTAGSRTPTAAGRQDMAFSSNFVGRGRL